jgi:hypothetical protein
MSANKFVLKGSGVEIDYTIGANQALPALVYKKGATVKQFKAIEIQTDTTGLGQMVSVALVRTTDAGGERFGFFLPLMDVVKGQKATFQTVGVDETFTGPDSVPHRAPSWRCIELHGTAQTVIVPLVSAPAA